jgi:hypothetical protein
MRTSPEAYLRLYSWMAHVFPSGSSNPEALPGARNDWKAVWLPGYTPAMPQMACLLLVTPH